MEADHPPPPQIHRPTTTPPPPHHLRQLRWRHLLPTTTTTVVRNLSATSLPPHPRSGDQPPTHPQRLTNHHYYPCSPSPKSPRRIVVVPHFQPPTKIIHSDDDICRFRDSTTTKNYLGFIVSLSESIRGHKISDPWHVSPTTASIVSIIETLIQFVDEIPPLPQSARYGNLAYRDWHIRMTENADNFMLQFLPVDLRSTTVELSHYFTDSFGNSSQIDYGTGHDTNLAAWLYCLARLGVINKEDYQSVVSRVFMKYMELMRKLQLVYSLEPAGSYGVWGLDDYRFLPFIFGSSQLVDHKYMKPKLIHNEDILENFANEYMYLRCIAFVKKVKKGLFAEHSPMLDDISGVPNWKKVNSGLLKMYKVEVMEKVPIMKHFLFGSLIKCLRLWLPEGHVAEKSEAKSDAVRL